MWDGILGTSRRVNNRLNLGPLDKKVDTHFNLSMRFQSSKTLERGYLEAQINEIYLTKKIRICVPKNFAQKKDEFYRFFI